MDTITFCNCGQDCNLQRHLIITECNHNDHGSCNCDFCIECDYCDDFECRMISECNNCLGHGCQDCDECEYGDCDCVFKCQSRVP